MRRRPGPVDVPEFPEDLEWLNVEQPLRLRDVSGKVILLNFWTSCCVNCMHVIPDLNQLLSKYEPELVVIGVHAPRCAAEREIEQLRAAVMRHEIAYPVVNDRDMRIWRAWEVDAWPTSILIGPFGRIIRRQKGEGVLRGMDETIRGAIQSAARSGGLNRARVVGDVAKPPSQSELSFPAGILADDRSDRLFISDTNANRIIATDFDGNVLEVVGTGRSGFEDGAFEEAAFNHPQGAAIDGNILYVADTGNHSIRRVDFNDRVVRTIAGTGRPAPALMEAGDATTTSLQSPWDVEVVHHRLYIAMAGAHQIWRMDLHSGALEAYAGGGSSGFTDGSRGTALLAQPSGLTSDGVRLFFTDAGASAIRWVYLPPALQLGTLVGQGIFEYGDRDGPGKEALLQFPLGLEHHVGELYVADTYNHRIKHLNARVSRIETLLGAGKPGFEDGDEATFNEPRDLSCGDGRLWIADTNNHAIRVAPLTGGPVSTLQLNFGERTDAKRRSP